MAPHRNPLAVRAAQGASGFSTAGKLSGSEDTPTPEHLQASYIARTYGVPRLLAEVVAVHAFACGGVR